MGEENKAMTKWNWKKGKERKKEIFSHHVVQVAEISPWRFSPLRLSSVKMLGHPWHRQHTNRYQMLSPAPFVWCDSWGHEREAGECLQLKSAQESFIQLIKKGGSLVFSLRRSIRRSGTPEPALNIFLIFWQMAHVADTKNTGLK